MGVYRGILFKVLLWAALCVLNAHGEIAEADVADKKYSGMCEVQNQKEKFGLPCQVSLFSYYNFDLIGSVRLLPKECDLCEPVGACTLESIKVAAVMRGGCSFDTKARNAITLGYQALIIINSYPDQENFPMGAADKEYQSPIPVVMMRTSTIEFFEQEQHSQVWLRLTSAKTSLKGQQDDVQVKAANTIRVMLLKYAVWLLPGALVLLVAYSHYLPEGKHEHAAVVVILLLFLALRQGTFRTQSGAYGSESVYHHSETDERIFAALVESVEQTWWDYSLEGKGVIESLGLSRDNYGDSLFIHPPLFVYTLVLMKRFFGFSLPTTVLCMQCGSMLLTGYLATTIITEQGKGFRKRAASIVAMALYSCCPLAAFCSQKVWIDNGLSFYCLLVASLHSLLWSRANTSTNTNSGSGVLLAKCLMSGLLLGLLVLNCKSTGLALLPYLVLTSVKHVTAKREGEGEAGPSLRSVLLWGPIVTVAMLLGAICAHGPWVWLYHRITGRWSPNAWPSAEMIATNQYIARAVARPWHFYFGVLLRFSPLLLVGLLDVAPAVRAFFLPGSITSSSSSSERKDERNRAWQRLSLASWPVAFVAGLTLLGVAGAGSQARFLLPAIAPLCSLTGAQLVSTAASTRSGLLVPLSAAAVLLAYMALHTVYYAILFPNLYADLDLSILELLVLTLSPTSSSAQISTQECMAELLAFLRHHGVHVG